MVEADIGVNYQLTRRELFGSRINRNLALDHLDGY